MRAHQTHSAYPGKAEEISRDAKISRADRNLREDDSRAWLLLAVAIFLLRVTPWSMAELWFDEVLTLQYFAIGQEDSTFLGIFRNYIMANNHFLNSAVYWWWVRFLNYNFTAHLLRWPSLFFGLATIAVVVLHWRYFWPRWPLWGCDAGHQPCSELLRTKSGILSGYVPGHSRFVRGNGNIFRAIAPGAETRLHSLSASALGDAQRSNAGTQSGLAHLFTATQ